MERSWTATLRFTAEFYVVSGDASWQVDHLNTNYSPPPLVLASATHLQPHQDTYIAPIIRPAANQTFFPTADELLVEPIGPAWSNTFRVAWQVGFSADGEVSWLSRGVLTCDICMSVMQILDLDFDFTEKWDFYLADLSGALQLVGNPIIQYFMPSEDNTRMVRMVIKQAYRALASAVPAYRMTLQLKGRALRHTASDGKLSDGDAFSFDSTLEMREYGETIVPD